MGTFNPEIAAQAMIPKDLLGQASSLHFSLHLASDSSEAALSEAAGGELHWAHRLPREESSSGALTSSLADRNWNEKIFRRCTVSYDAELFTLVPSGFFSAEKASELLSFSSGKSCRRVNHMALPEWDAVMIWEEPMDMATIPDVFPNARLMPSAYLVMKHCSTVIDRNTNTIALLRSGSLVNLFVFKQGMPVLVNAHQIHDDEDILYYASNAAMTLGIDFENCDILIYDRSIDVSLVNLLKHYNRNIKTMFSDSEGEVKAGFISHLHVLCA